MDPEKCGEKKMVAGKPFVCILPPHDAGNIYVDNFRRRQGRFVKADKHLFVAEESVPPEDVP